MRGEDESWILLEQVGEAQNKKGASRGEYGLVGAVSHAKQQTHVALLTLSLPSQRVFLSLLPPVLSLALSLAFSRPAFPPYLSLSQPRVLFLSSFFSLFFSLLEVDLPLNSAFETF